MTSCSVTGRDLVRVAGRISRGRVAHAASADQVGQRRRRPIGPNGSSGKSLGLDVGSVAADIVGSGGAEGGGLDEVFLREMSIARSGSPI